MKERLLSIDVLRGMTIFFMIVVNTPGSWTYVYAPLKHAPWDGLTPTDLVFPFFVFIVGLSMSFSFRKFEQQDRRKWISKIVRRTAMIFLVGLLLNWYPFFNKSIGDLRIFGVLQRIALAYGIGSMIAVFAKQKWLPFIFSFILLGYWGILLLFGGENPLSLEDNAVRMLDLFILGENHIYGGYGLPFDPEGILSSIPSAATVLFGFWIGKIIQHTSDHMQKVQVILRYGIIAIILGIIWHYLGCPVNKPIWSSSYVLVSGGLSILLLSLLIYLIDVKSLIRWTYVFRAFGLNPLISYVLSGLVVKTFFLIKVGDGNLYGWFYQNVFQRFIGNYSGSFIQSLTYTMFIWLFAWYLFRTKKVIKL